MTLSLHTVRPASGAKKTKKRVGRGLGSTGTYSGRGVKGQRARSGGRSGLKLKGLRGIMLAIPKERGFNSRYPKPAAVNLELLSKMFADGATVTLSALKKKRLVPSSATHAKILGRGTIAIALKIRGCEVSGSAKEKLLNAGATIQE